MMNSIVQNYSSENFLNIDDYKYIHYICPKCISFPLIKMINNKTIILICPNQNHKEEIEIKNYIERLILPETKNINIKNLKLYLKCKFHQNKEVKKTCVNCRENLCDKCLKRHKNHKIKTFEELKEEIKNVEKILNEFDFSQLNLKNTIESENKNSIESIDNNINKQNNSSDISSIESSTRDYIKNEKNNNNDSSYLKILINIILNDSNNFPNYVHYENMRYINSFIGEKLKLEYYSYSNKDKFNIRLFGEKFVKNNIKNCYLIIDGEIKELSEKYTIKSVDEKLTVFLIKENKNLTDMSYMFCECDILSSIVDSSWRTEKVTNMSYMFYNCKALIYLCRNLQYWKTNNVIDFSHIFSGCKALSNEAMPDISEWNTSKVQNMSYMFNECESFELLVDISKWDTKEVKLMCNMFSNCLALESLKNIFKWNTENVTDMSYMFYNCISLKRISDFNCDTNEYGQNNKINDEMKWDTSKVTNMSNIFNGCEDLEYLPEKISKWDISKVKYMSYMFSNCKSLNSFPNEISNWNTENALYMNNMFENCSSLEFLPEIANWNINNLIDISNIIKGCNILKNIHDFSKWKDVFYKKRKMIENLFKEKI